MQLGGRVEAPRFRACLDATSSAAATSSSGTDADARGGAPAPRGRRPSGRMPDAALARVPAGGARSPPSGTTGDGTPPSARPAPSGRRRSARRPRARRRRRHRAPPCRPAGDGCEDPDRRLLGERGSTEDLAYRRLERSDATADRRRQPVRQVGTHRPGRLSTVRPCQLDREQRVAPLSSNTPLRSGREPHSQLSPDDRLDRRDLERPQRQPGDPSLVERP